MEIRRVAAMSVTLLFAFTLGVLLGGLSLFTVWRYALHSPEYAAIFVGRMTRTIGLSHWISVSDDHVVARCPRCSHIEKRSPSHPHEAEEP
jgi:hypothetical protein